MRKQIPFSPPFIDEYVEKEVIDCLRSGWITTGPQVRKLEGEFCKFLAASKCLAVNSWTSATILVLKWYGIGEGDEVIIPAYTYSATALAVIHVGAKPVMVDINDDFNISSEQIKKKITVNTKAIMPVDIGGWPADYKEIKEIIEGNTELFIPKNAIQREIGRMLLISDAAHSFGSRYCNNRHNDFADFIIYSLHAVKNLTSAEGGIISINLGLKNEEIYNYLKLSSLNCQSKDAFSKSKPGEWRYDILGLGYKFNMPDVLASIALGQLRTFDYSLLVRRNIAFEYLRRFEKHEEFILPNLIGEHKESSYHLFLLRIRNISELERDEIISKLAQLGISTNVHFQPLPILTYFKNLGFTINDFQNSMKNYECEISLPIYPQLTTEDVTFICDSIIELVKKN